MGEAALVTASGMAAISTSLLAVLKSGDHLLAVDCPYGGTRTFIVDDLPRFGISHTFIDGDDPRDWKKKLRPETRAIYVETITNPLMQVPDLRAAVDFVRRSARAGQPFFLYLPYSAPHYPLHAPPEYLDRFPDLADDRRIMAAADFLNGSYDIRWLEKFVAEQQG